MHLIFGRVPNRFFGIRDFPYLKLGIRDIKAKTSKTRDWKYARELECPKYPSELRDCANFWVGITGLKNPIGDPPLGLWCVYVSFYKFVYAPIFLLHRIGSKAEAFLSFKVILRWLNTVLRAVSVNSRNGACFKLDKQTWRRKSNGTQKTISQNLLNKIFWYLAQFLLSSYFKLWGLWNGSWTDKFCDT